MPVPSTDIPEFTPNETYSTTVPELHNGNPEGRWGGKKKA
jgi:hypothetical protein